MKNFSALGFNFVLHECCNCGVMFAITKRLDDARLSDKGSFHCPHGHSQFYTESTSDKMRRERDRLKQKLAEKDDEIRHRNEMIDRERERTAAAKRSASAMKGQVTKIKNRVEKGVCPCCNRSFVNLQKHMASQHADWSPEKTTE